MWRVANNCLPTRRNLKDRNVIPEDVCPLCDEVIETTIHILRDCLLLQEVWGDGGPPHVLHMQAEEIQEWLMQARRSTSNEVWGKFVVSTYLL